jgi:hypothetical protein
MSDGGKGSKPRPISVSDVEYAARWDAIFMAKTPEACEDAEAALQELVDINESLGLYNQVPLTKQ